MVGIRFNLSTHGMRQFSEPGAERLLARIKEMGWFLQIHCEKDELAEAAPIIRQAGVRLMVDHFGRPDVARGIAHPGFRTLLEFGRAGNAVVKLSGPFRSSVEGYPYRDVDPFIAAAIEAFTLDHCVWGSDWPFVRMDERIDYGPQLSACSAGCRTRRTAEGAVGHARPAVRLPIASRSGLAAQELRRLLVEVLHRDLLAQRLLPVRRDLVLEVGPVLVQKGGVHQFAGLVERRA